MTEATQDNWQAEQPSTNDVEEVTEEVTPDSINTEDQPTLEEQLAQAKKLTNELQWENTYREAITQAHFPDAANDVVRELLEGAQIEQIAPTIAKLSQFADVAKPESTPSQRPIDGLKPGSGRNHNTPSTAWSDALKI